MGKMALALHGGAGTILRSQMTPDLEREYRKGLEDGLQAGWAVLESGGTALDAVEAALVSLEDFPLFNAGRGSVFTHEGEQEMDASIMDGANLRAGSVAFVKNIRNPVKLARLVMERTEHVMLAGEGAEQFAEELGVRREPDEYFFTEHRWLQLQEALAAGRVLLDHTASEPSAISDALGSGPDHPDVKLPPTPSSDLGTVGAVARDARGHLAAATSTGGMTNKKYGRVGDTPLVGAGTYADDLVAVSCTGHGEYFMLGATAYDVAARMRYKLLSCEKAGVEAVERLTEIGGDGGLIAVDAAGNLSLAFNSEGMYRGWIEGDGRPVTAIYRD